MEFIFIMFFCLPDISVQPAQNEMGRLMNLDLLLFDIVFKAIFSLLVANNVKILGVIFKL